MNTHRSVLTAMGFLSLSACAVMDPYIRHDRAPNLQQVEACATQYPSDMALKYACGMMVRMERARSEVTRTRSGLTAAIFPLAGIVGYNSARGFNAPTNAALTSGGFAGYSVVTTLAQPDRIRIYDNGLKSTSCAIGLYQRAIASGKAESLDRIVLREELIVAKRQLVEIRNELTRSGADTQAADSASRVIEAMYQASVHGDPDRDLKSRLMQSVMTTISEVNAQLTLTIPSNPDSFGSAIDSLHVENDKRSSAGTKMAWNSIINQLNGAATQAGMLNNASTTTGTTSFRAFASRSLSLFDLFEAVQDEKPEDTQVDFTSCNYAAVSDVGVQAPTARLMLGAGDNMNNSTIELKANEKRGGIRIYGGLPPYDQGVKGPEPQLSATIEGENGVSNLILVAPNPNTSEDRIYDVTVTDAAGRYTKVLHVKVPKSSPPPVPVKRK